MAKLRQLLDQWDSAYLLYLDDEDHLANPAQEQLQRRSADSWPRS